MIIGLKNLVRMNNFAIRQKWDEWEKVTFWIWKEEFAKHPIMKNFYFIRTINIP